MSEKIDHFTPLNICVLTVTDTRSYENDSSGDTLCSAISAAGHTLYQRDLVKDDIYQIRAVVSAWIADPEAHAIITTGGTGFAGRDSTPEAIIPLLDKTIDGFGELFRHMSFDEIGTSTIQSRALAGLANQSVIFCLPGSTGACKTGWERLIEPQLNSLTRPCNFVGQLTRK